MLRPCSVCGTLTQGLSRCAAHQTKRPSRFDTRTDRPSAWRRGYDAEWRRLSRALISENPWCVECGSREDLTADHIVPLAAGGESIASNVQVLCRSCNGTKSGKMINTY